MGAYGQSLQFAHNRLSLCTFVALLGPLSGGDFRRKMTTTVGNRGELWTSPLSPHFLSPHLDFPNLPLKNKALSVKDDKREEIKMKTTLQTLVEWWLHLCPPPTLSGDLSAACRGQRAGGGARQLLETDAAHTILDKKDTSMQAILKSNKCKFHMRFTCGYFCEFLDSQRGRGVTDRGVTALKVLRGFRRFSRGFFLLEEDFLFETAKKVLRSAEKFSEPFPLFPLPLHSSAMLSVVLVYVSLPCNRT